MLTRPLQNYFCQLLFSWSQNLFCRFQSKIAVIQYLSISREALSRGAAILLTMATQDANSSSPSMWKNKDTQQCSALSVRKCISVAESILPSTSTGGAAEGQGAALLNRWHRFAWRNQAIPSIILPLGPGGECSRRIWVSPAE